MENHDEDQDVQGQNPVENGPENPFHVFMEYIRQNINPVPEQNRYQDPEPPHNVVASSFKAFQSIYDLLNLKERLTQLKPEHG